MNINSGTAFATTIPAIQRLLVFEARASRLQLDRARRARKGPYRGERNLPVYHGDELRQEPDGEIHWPHGGPASNYAEGDKPESSWLSLRCAKPSKKRQAQYFANDRLRKMAGVAG